MLLRYLLRSTHQINQLLVDKIIKSVYKKTIKMISNGQKVIGIEENGDVVYDSMSSCPVSEYIQ